MANTYVRRRNAPYQIGQSEPYKLSRSKIELFMQCPRCFWLDERLKIKRPSGPPFQINKAIDELLKKEFDVYRDKKKPHPMMVKNQIKAIPFAHADLSRWRTNFTGVSALHEPTNLYIFGAIDDIWEDENGQVIIVDYKATAKQADVTIDADWQISYKRQMEVYQWLLRQNGFKVSDTAYFVYANGRLDAEGFFDKVEFKTKIIPYKGSDKWIEPTLAKMKACLEGDMPAVGTAAMGGECDYCSYAKARTELTLKSLKK
ncbi:MAG TPA: PD-(D/E)XK nuclease family protein [Candidatus Saccharimonadales bacterium]|nr:PD-(D/E)XK nuclease family protein [Candidatus Saccharimonadales bacterium]